MVATYINLLELFVSSLPVAAVLPSLVKALQQAPQVLLNAPTGAGKSTWLPLQILQQGQLNGRILLLEPRRLAARNVAQRMAELLGEQPGQTIGYRMRAETCVGPDTRIEVITEGILTRIIQQDPGLSGIGLVILDEFHERSLQADLALALLLDIQQGLRDDLKLLIMSATLDNPRLQQCLPDAVVISSQGRSFAVERRYSTLPAQLTFDEALAQVVVNLLRTETGSILVFLPGVGEIVRVQQLLQMRVAQDVHLCPLYGALPLTEQRKALIPATIGTRKVVLATNIAQTSLTIEGIRLVVDCALERVARFDPRTGLTRLVTQRISQAAMTQRAGRAGRLEPGICLHLISHEQAQRAASQSDPEILHSDLAGLLLETLHWGCQHTHQLTWLDAPPETNLSVARELLSKLGALDQQSRLTSIGQRMVQMGNEPRLAAMLVAAQTADEKATAAWLAAILEEPPRGQQSDLSEIFGRRQENWQQRAAQLRNRLACRDGAVDITLAAPLLAHAFADRIARRRGDSGRYQLANGMGAMLNQDDALTRHEWLLAPLLLQRDQSSDARILQAWPLDIDALLARCPSLITQNDCVEWDNAQGTLKALRRSQLGKLVVKVQSLEKPSESERTQALLNAIGERGLTVLNWSPQAEQLRIRLACAAQWLPEYPWPEVSHDALLRDLSIWLLPEMTGMHSLASLKTLDVTRALLNLLNWPQRQRLDSALPTHYTVPTGSRITIRYDNHNPPVLAVRIQEMFGQAQTPIIAEGRVPLVLELLSPARRPLQITRDLSAFWNGAYREVQKEMKGRYPKHAWPTDPLTASPGKK